MVDISARSFGYEVPARAVRTSERSFAKGFLIGVPLALALWAPIVWAVVRLF